MRWMICAAMLLPVVASAADAPPPDKLAMGQMLIEALNREAADKAQIIALQRKVEEASRACVTPPAKAPAATK